MQKKGQAAVFVILGVVLLISVILLINFKTGFLKSLFQKSTQEIASVPEQLQEVTDFIDRCLETASRNSLYQIGRNGGYYTVPVDSSIIWFIEEVPYYYLDGKINIPSLGLVETELSKSISNEVIQCLDFTEFKDEGFAIKTQNYSVAADIQEKKILVTMDYKILIEKSGVSSEFTEFSSEIDSNLASMHAASEELISIYSKKPGFVCLTCMEEIADIYPVKISTIPVSDVTVLKNNIIWFLIDDKEFQIDEERNLTLRFIVEQ